MSDDDEEQWLLCFLIKSNKRDYVSLLMEAQTDEVDIKQDKGEMSSEKIAETRYEKKMTFEVSNPLTACIFRNVLLQF